MGLRRRVRGARAIAAAATMLVVVLLGLPAGAGAAAGAGLAPVPGISPPGANDWSCRPTARRPVPVILVHGTFGDMTVSWNALSPLLKADGFCVFALDYGDRATAPMEGSADELAAFARRVLSATGAAKVSFVGHSQGGSLSRLTVRYRALLDRTEDVVGLAPSSHGTTNPFAPPAGTLGCGACTDQVAGSPLMQKLNAPPRRPGRCPGPSCRRATTRWSRPTPRRPSTARPSRTSSCRTSARPTRSSTSGCPGTPSRSSGCATRCS